MQTIEGPADVFAAYEIANSAMVDKTPNSAARMFISSGVLLTARAIAPGIASKATISGKSSDLNCDRYNHVQVATLKDVVLLRANFASLKNRK